MPVSFRYVKTCFLCALLTLSTDFSMVGQASSPDIVMTSGDACPTFITLSSMTISARNPSSNRMPCGTLSELEPVAQPSSQLPEAYAQEAPRIRFQVILDQSPCEGARHNPPRLPVLTRTSFPISFSVISSCLCAFV